MKTSSDTSGFRSSLDMLIEEERFAKANAASPWECLLTELGDMFAKAGVPGFRCRPLRATSARRTTMSADWQETMAKAIPAPQPKAKPARVVAIKAHPALVREVDLVAKAQSLLRTGEGLTAEQRGNLMLGITAAHDRSFAKAQRAERHPVAVQVEKIRDALEQAQAERELPPNAALYVDEALRHLAQIGSDIVTADDAGRLQHLLLQIKLAMSAGDSDALGVGDAR